MLCLHRFTRKRLPILAESRKTEFKRCSRGFIGWKLAGRYAVDPTPMVQSKQLFLLCQQHGQHTLFQQITELLWIVVEGGIQKRFNVTSCKINLQLLSVKALCCMDCPGKRGLEW